MIDKIQTSKHSAANDVLVQEEAVQALENSKEQLSPHVKTRLAEMRYQAVQSMSEDHKRSWSPSSYFFSSLAWAGSAALLVIAVTLVFNLNSESETAVNLQANSSNSADRDAATNQALNNEDSSLEDLLFLTSTDEIELDIIQDIEFAYWLAEELAQDDTNKNDEGVGA